MMSKVSRIDDALAIGENVKYWREKHGQMCDDVWRAIYPDGNTAGDYDYPGQIIREVRFLREIAMALGWDGQNVIDAHEKLIVGRHNEQD